MDASCGMVFKWLGEFSYAFSASAVNSKIYVFGGSEGQITNQEYDPITDKWATRTQMPTGRWASVAATVNGSIYVIGGWNGSLLATNEEYDPSTTFYIHRKN